MVSATPGPSPESGTAALIKDSNAQHFMTDVIQVSRQVPVVVDFWAPWCGPCRQLSPILEKAVTAARGRLRLVKINVDEPINQPLAQQLRIQSIPAVYAFYNGQPVDGFLGALPESQIKQFLDRLLAAAGGEGEGEISIEDALKQADELIQAGDIAEAEQVFVEILAIDQNHPKGLAGLARVKLAQGDLAAAEATLDRIAPEHANDAEVTRARAAIDLARQSGGGGNNIAELRARVAADAHDHAVRFDLAVALTGVGETEAAVDELIEIVRRDRSWNDEAARKQLLKLFEALGPADPITLAGRRRLSAILFS